MKLTVLSALMLALVCVSCAKEEPTPCSTEINLTATSTTPTVGESFSITATQVDVNDMFQWFGPGLSSGVHGSSVTIDNPAYEARGWYHCAKSNVDCGETVYDSIFIDVKLRQGTAPCTVANNRLECSSVPDADFYSVQKRFDPVFNAMSLYGQAGIGYPSDFKLLFNSYNGNTEPVDGIYTTQNSPTFGVTDPYVAVSLSFVYGGQYFHSHPGKDVYVSHVNGKLSARFCGIPFSNGANIITCSGTITEP